MIWLIIKSDVKRYFRDKGNLVMSVLMPIIFIAILSNAFGSFMNNKFELSPFTVGYAINQKSPIYNNFDQIKSELKDNKITLVEIDKDKAFNQISADKLAGFVEFDEKDYKFYKNDNLNIDAGIFESVLQSISYETGTYTEMYKLLAQYRIAPPAQNQTGNSNSALLSVKSLKTTPFPSALTYYGIVMIIQMLCFSVMSAPTLINTDRKNLCNIRIALTKVNPLSVFIARVISSVLSGVLQISAGILASVIILKVDFGSKWPIIIGIMLLFSVAMSSVGVLLGYLMRNVAVTRTFVYALTFGLNFFGGSYMQYLYASGSLLNLMKQTPIYYINRSLVELATIGSSSVLPTAMTIIISTIIGSIIIGAFVYSRREGKLCAN